VSFGSDISCLDCYISCLAIYVDPHFSKSD